MFVFRTEETNRQNKLVLFVGFSLFGQDHFPLFLQFYLFLLMIQFFEIAGSYKGRAALLFRTTERKLAALSRGWKIFKYWREHN